MRPRLPDYLKRGIIDTEKTKEVRKILQSKGLNTVCDAARCPNKGECYAKHTATFLVLGDICTRNCRFCSVKSGLPTLVDPDEPSKIKDAVKELGLKYVVITMVTRDDLSDGGASHIAKIVNEIKLLDDAPKVEVLISDLAGNFGALDVIMQTQIDVLNHNIETVKELYSSVRPKALYQRSLDVLDYTKKNYPSVKTKTGIMLGLGETIEQLKRLFSDLKAIDCDILTAGQYIQPTKNHIQVDKYLTEEEFLELENIARAQGLKYLAFGPLVRSSYKAKELFFL
ncbi:MAG: lipoyl synthase [Candidatus Gastranaerophilales bacterium]|nr:lipoyl synthase [Candidatus Gastranaerophilales bacterium]